MAVIIIFYYIVYILYNNQGGIAMEKLLFQNLCPELSADKIAKIAQDCGFSKRMEKKLLLKVTYHIFVKNLLRVLLATTI